MLNKPRTNKFLPEPTAIIEQNWNEDVRPLVSISCITYNHVLYIRDAIEGFLMQKTTFPVEILIYDDASTDGTIEIVKEYEKTPNISIYPVYQSENQYSKGIRNISASFNYSRARGIYIALCEGDDYWTDPLKLQKQIDFLEEYPNYAGAYHDTLVVYQNREGKHHLFRENLKNEISVEDTISTSAPFHTSSFVFRINALSTPEWTSRVKSGDMALFSIVASKGALKKVGEVCSVYRKHDGSMTNSKYISDTYHQDRIELIELLNQFHKYEYASKAQSVIKHHRSQVANPSEKDNFINIEFTINNLDLYLMRTSIKNALNWVLPALKGHLLDAGCGKMPYKNYIIKNSMVNKYVGLDIETALAYDEDVKPDYTWDGKTMPFENSNFDCCIATEVLEHCPEPEVILSEIHRVLKPGGILFFTVPFLWNLHEVPNDEYRYTPFSLERHLINSGFANITIKATGGWHASTAQMVGLWVRRAPMPKIYRLLLSIIAKPIMKIIMKKEKSYDSSFLEGQMITGLYGLAKKTEYET